MEYSRVFTIRPVVLLDFIIFLLVLGSAPSAFYARRFQIQSIHFIRERMEERGDQNIDYVRYCADLSPLVVELMSLGSP